MNFDSKLGSIFIAGTGLTSSAVAQEVIPAINQENGSIINVVVQLLIGVVTLIKLLKKEKK